MILLSHDYFGLAEWCWGSSPSHPARDQSRYTPSNQGLPIVPKLIACIEDQGHMGLSENRSYQNFMVFTAFLFKIAILGGIPVIYIYFQTHPNIFQIQSAGLTVHQQSGRKSGMPSFLFPNPYRGCCYPRSYCSDLLACCSYPPVCSFKTSMFDDVRWLLYPLAIWPETLHVNRCLSIARG